MTAKYQPYKGTGSGKPWYWYPGVPKKARTKSDWVWSYRHESHECFWRYCDTPWWKHVSTSGSVFEKRKTHRDFRRLAKHTIYLDLMGEEVSHNFCVYGDWLD